MSYRNPSIDLHSIDLLCKPIDLFLYEDNPGTESVNKDELCGGFSDENVGRMDAYLMDSM